MLVTYPTISGQRIVIGEGEQLEARMLTGRHIFGELVYRHIAEGHLI